MARPLATKPALQGLCHHGHNTALHASRGSLSKAAQPPSHRHMPCVPKAVTRQRKQGHREMGIPGNPDTIPLASTGIPCPGKQRILPAQCDTRVNVAIPVTTFILHSSWCHSQWPSHHKWLMVNASGTAAHTSQPGMSTVFFLPHFLCSWLSPSLSTSQ